MAWISSISLRNVALICAFRNPGGDLWAKFKQFPPRRPLVARKRSGRVALIAMGVSVSALALTGCEEQVDALQYSSAEACIVGGELSEADCQAGFAAAQKDHARVAPKYQSPARL